MTAKSTKTKSKNIVSVLKRIFIIVIVVAFVAAVVPVFIMYWEWKSNSIAKKDLQHAFITAQQYFAEYPDKPVTPDILKTNGFLQSDNVMLAIPNGTMNELEMTSKHVDGTLTYTINESGGISSSFRP